MELYPLLLAEFDREMGTARKFLERLPDDSFDWKPHEKSMSLGGLANHLAHVATWAAPAMLTDSMDVATYQRPELATSRDEILASFDRGRDEARTVIEGATDEKLAEPWTFMTSGTVLFTMPRHAVLRNFVLSHTIHHRAQLGMYYRLLGVPVPGAYGPSGDES